MARPTKEGFEYFPFDVAFFNNRKIKGLRGKYGYDGVITYIYLLCQIWDDNGYYMVIDDDTIDVIADDLKIGTNEIRQIINNLCKRSLFDDTLFASVNVLSSRGIQRRFQLAAKSKRREVEVDGRFWLLNEKETESFIKVTYFTDKYSKNPDKYSKNPDKYSKNPYKDKIKDKNKIKDKDSIGTDKPSRTRTVFKKPTVEEIALYCQERGNSIDAEHFFDYYESKGWTVGKQPMKDWKAAVRNWERNGYDATCSKNEQVAKGGYDQRQYSDELLNGFINAELD